jgi:hypothetical protein
LTINDADLRQRLNTEAQATMPRGGRCGIEVVTQGETLRMFPTRSYRLLCRFDVAVARIADQIVIRAGDAVIGRYPRNAAANQIVELQITMSIGTLGGIRTPVQFVELWLQKDLGPVIRDQGVFVNNRSRGRISECTVGGMRFRGEDPSSPFEYHILR